jgi:Ca2+-binding EF-hand superfamily protein
MARMGGGAGELLKSFKLFASGKGEIGPNQLLSVVQELGININRREAFALFGRFDINKDGGIVYYEFVDSLLAKGESSAQTRDATYYDK